MSSSFNVNCQCCPRLAAHLEQVRCQYPDYYTHPVAPFGSETPDLFVVGLAPGLHGANASGRPFTGDYAGILLYQTLYAFGFSNQPLATALDDGLELRRCRITNAVKCLPPQNKPTTAEIIRCNIYLRSEISQLPEASVILALGGVAHQAVLRAVNLRPSAYRFAHAAINRLPNGLWLVDSYHCSRYMTQTKRLTETMFDAVFTDIRHLVDRRRGF